MVTSADGPIATQASDQVNEAFNDAERVGGLAFNEALGLISDLKDIVITPISFDVSFTTPIDLITGFQRPEMPTRPDPSAFIIDTEIPDVPPLSPITIPNVGDPPTFEGEAPSLDFSGQPSPFSGQVPDNPPALFPIPMPDDLELKFPPLPTFEELDIPGPPDIIEHTFDSTKPTFTTPVPDVDVNVDPINYSSELLDSVRAEVSRMLKGGTGLPPAIEQMLFDRSRSREDGLANRAVQEVMDEFAARGFTLPSGVMDSRIREVRQRNQEQSSSLNRELTIQAAQLEIENLRFSIEQGVALENVLISLAIEEAQFKFAVRRTVAELALQVYSAQVEVFNAEVAAYRVDAEVFAELIRAEIAKVEVYRAQLEGERVKGEVNQQQLDLYIGRLEGLNTLVAVYAAEIEAANTVAATNETMIRGYAARVDAFRSEVEAKEAEFAAWATKIQGELGKVQGFEAETRAFAARASAYESGVRGASLVSDVELNQQRLEVDAFRAQIEAVRSDILAQSERIQATSSLYSSEASVFSSQGQIASAEAETNTRQFVALLEESKIKSEQALQAAELQVNQLVAITDQIVTSKTGAAQAASQLAAASWSAVNASASVSAGANTSNSWSTSWFKDIT